MRQAQMFNLSFKNSYLHIGHFIISRRRFSILNDSFFLLFDNSNRFEQPESGRLTPFASSFLTLVATRWTWVPSLDCSFGLDKRRQRFVHRLPSFGE